MMEVTVWKHSLSTNQLYRLLSDDYRVTLVNMFNELKETRVQIFKLERREKNISV